MTTKYKIHGNLSENKIASNLKVMIFPQDAPARINIPWGDPPKPNLFRAELMYGKPTGGMASYLVKSPLIGVDDNYSVILFFIHNKHSYQLPTMRMSLQYMQGGKHYEYEETLPDHKITEPQLLGYLKRFWEKNKEMLKATLIRKDVKVASDLSQYQVNPLFSNVRNQEVLDMKVASSGKDIMWGDPPKPNIWSAELQPWKPRQGSGEKYIIRSPLMEGGLLVSFGRVQGIRRDDIFVTVRDGESYENSRVVVDMEIEKVPHLSPTKELYGTWLTEVWQRSRKLRELVRSRLKSNVKIASNLSQYQIDPRFVKPAPKKMTRTAGEVRFVKDNSNDASSWAWGDTGASERRIPADFVFKKNAQKALAKTMRSSLSAMGHALSAYHTFTKIKSADVSPDGALGGRGYIQKVAHMRRAYMNAAEALSALSDTIYDEINAPHWNDAGTPKEVKEIMEEAEEIREDPEAWAEEQENSKDEGMS